MLNFEYTDDNSFGQSGKQYFGISDSNKGVQWNIAVCKDTGNVRIGVNLEGLTYIDWPISRFILTELHQASFDKIKEMLDTPDKIYIRFSRDAWQRASRLTIAEEFIGGKEFLFSECDTAQWVKILNEAYECLSKKNDKYCRAEQIVTIKTKKGERVAMNEVSPHLTIWSPVSLNGNIRESVQKTINKLQPVYEWISKACQQ